MEYLPLLNLLLEALAYLGRRAAGNTIQRLTERLQSNGVTDLARFRQRLAPIETLMNELDRQQVFDDLLAWLEAHMPREGRA